MHVCACVWIIAYACVCMCVCVCATPRVSMCTGDFHLLLAVAGAAICSLSLDEGGLFDVGVAVYNKVDCRPEYENK